MSKVAVSIIVALVLTVAVLQPLIARAANYKLTTDPKKTCTAIEIEGEVDIGDYNRFALTLEQAMTVAPLRRLYLNSRGGNVGTALAITDLIRNKVPTVETIVQSRHSCNSACVIILTVGSRRNVSTDASLSIHQVFREKTGIRDAELTQKLGQYLALNGMPPDVMWTMGNLEPDEVLAITPSNAKRLGFGSFNFYGSTNPPATPQCSWDGFILRAP